MIIEKSEGLAYNHGEAAKKQAKKYSVPMKQQHTSMQAAT